jgi:hypothetical protein
MIASKYYHMNPFVKIMNTAEKTCKSTIEKAISSEMTFSVQVAPIENSDGEFAPDNDVAAWLRSFMMDTLRFQTIAPRALEGMKKAWLKANPSKSDTDFRPKKQACEILAIVIAPSDMQMYISYSIPLNDPDIDPVLPGLIPYELGSTHGSGAKRNIRAYTSPIPSDSSPFKHKDTLLSAVLDHLKVMNIYVDDEEDEGMVNYLEMV